MVDLSETKKIQEINNFFKNASKPHRRINPCFMTGKGCVYTEQIDREIEHRRDRNNFEGFAILPYQPNISVYYELCLQRFIEGSYLLPEKLLPNGSPVEKMVDVIRADQVRKTGYVICEKVCKKIQESDFVIADISVPNANVFYEMGLAYGIDQKILVIYYKKNDDFGSKVAEYLRPAGCNAFVYEDLSPLSIDKLSISDRLWMQTKPIMIETSPTTLLFDELDLMGYPFPKDDRKLNPAESSKQSNEDIFLPFSAHVQAAVGVSIDNILTNRLSSEDAVSIPETYLELIDRLKSTELIQEKATFTEALEKVNRSFCTIIRTGGKGCNPMMYFWLGYCHAQGKNVIPITLIEGENDREVIDDLAFDIRALWHMTFNRQEPRLLEQEIEDTFYQMILTDFSEWSRRRFWDVILEKRGKVSVFTGALHNKDIGREMIGDWDLRAVSELTSYLASHQYRATIESPIYQIENVEPKGVPRDKYISELEAMLMDKNCIIIASPDVNPLTEIVLGKIYGIDKKDWFTGKDKAIGIPNAVIAFKTLSEKSAQNLTPRIFYQEITDETADRGFIATFIKGQKISGKFISQTQDAGDFLVHAHLAVVPNPYHQVTQSEKKFIILLNGVSGPATFALTHVLTGGVSNEFVSYRNGFDPNSQSESILKTILEDLGRLLDNQKRGIQYLIQVRVGPPSEDQTTGQTTSRNIFDWRHIWEWELVGRNVFDLG